MEQTKLENVFVQGAISPEFIADTISDFKHNTSLGAHDIFIGQIRADTLEGKDVIAIEYSAYPEMADKLFKEIGNHAIEQFELGGLTICHSLGLVKTGEICLFVMASSKHRKAVMEGLRYVVEEIKKTVPVFGKEVFKDESYKWKVNK
jgi:molybdopterin synthase catalytic subunit